MVSIILIALAGICKAVMDKVQFHFGKSIFADKNQLFWNPGISWRNKWKDGDPTLGEKFWGSSTIFVWTTDAWHLFQSIQIKFLVLAIVFYSPIHSWWLDFILLYIIYTGIFELFFSKVFADDSKK
jgi:hypothetical protein